METAVADRGAKATPEQKARLILATTELSLLVIQTPIEHIPRRLELSIENTGKRFERQGGK